MNSLHAIVAKARHIPRWLERLRIAGRIGRAARELVLARRSPPRRPPSAPAMNIALGFQARLAPVALNAKFDTLDRRGARPGAAQDLDLAGVDHAAAHIEIRNP